MFKIADKCLQNVLVCVDIFLAYGLECLDEIHDDIYAANVRK